MAVHVATLTLQGIDDSVVTIVSKGDPNTTISEVLSHPTSSEPRIVEDASMPNTSGYPTIKRYLELEEAAGFKLGHMDQTYIVTYDT